MPGQHRYGLLRYSNTGNLGDEIQSLAARRFLPRVDYLLNRDRLNAHALGLFRPVRLIMNGWFTHNPENWPPHPAIRPLVISFHLSDQATRNGFSAAEALVVGENAAWLRQYGPVGARDRWTLDLLRVNNIDAWFSGCITLTLEPPPHTVRQDYVVVNDVNAEVAAIAAKRVSSPVISTTHLETKVRLSRTRFRIAERLLRLYAEARCVVTSRLHCALPCLAMGTPVLFIPTARGIKRYSGLLDLVHNCSEEDFREQRTEFNLKTPPPNPSAFIPLRDKLIRQCTQFIASGFQ